MLPGFVYPVYTCVCPQTKWTMDVRCLTVAEEDKILQSATFGYQMIHNLNTVIYDCIVTMPDVIKTFDDFRKNITPKDRDALLYSLLQASDADEQVLDVRCMSCGATNRVKVKLSECFNANLYPGEPGEILKQTGKVTTTVGEYNVDFVYKVPTLDTERIIMTYLGSRRVSPTILTMLMIVSEITIRKGDDIKEQFTTTSDIEIVLRSIPSKVVKKVRKQYMQDFGQYGIDLNYRYICSDCGSSNSHIIDLMEVLFRTVTGGEE